MRDPCPAWLSKEAREILQNWLSPIIGISLSLGLMPTSMKEVIIPPFLKKANVDRSELSNFHPLSNVPFSGEVDRAGGGVSTPAIPRGG